MTKVIRLRAAKADAMPALDAEIIAVITERAELPAADRRAHMALWREAIIEEIQKRLAPCGIPGRDHIGGACMHHRLRAPEFEYQIKRALSRLVRKRVLHRLMDGRYLPYSADLHLRDLEWRRRYQLEQVEFVMRQVDASRRELARIDERIQKLQDENRPPTVVYRYDPHPTG